MFKKIVTVSLNCGLALALATSVMAEPSQSQLRKRAKITKNEAEHIALSQAPHGKVRSAELQMLQGKLIWSFAIIRPSEAVPIKIEVDAMTGKIVSVPVENPNSGPQREGAAKPR